MKSTMIPMKPSRFVQHIDGLINSSDKAQRQIAYEMGYEKPNIVTMFKQGTTRVPADKVPLLANALGVDRAELLRMWMEEYAPEMLAVIDDNIGMALSRNERAWVTNLRRVFHDTGLPGWDDHVEDALKPVARSLMPSKT
jgi:hypothetical protein